MLRGVLVRRGVAAAGDQERDRHVVLIRVALAVLAASLLAHILIVPGFVDLHVYRSGGHAWLNGIGLYSDRFPALVPNMPLAFTYPPFAAILFGPVSLLPWHVAKVLLTLASALGLVTATLTVAGRLYGRRSIAVVLGLGVAACWALFEPARSTIGFGQINMILMGLVCADCLLPRVRWPRGMLIGLATAIKLTPAVFVLFFLVRRQYRPAAVAFGSFLAFSLVGLALAPSDTRTYWFDALLDPDRIGGLAYAFNQCFQAVLYRLMEEGAARSLVWVALGLASLALAWIGARKARAAGQDVTALLLVAVWGMLASPVSWSHHWVWILPGTVLLLHYTRHGGPLRIGLAVFLVAVFAIGAHSYLPQTGDVELRWSWWQHLFGSGYVLVGVAMLIVFALRPGERAPLTGTAGRARE
ncbi:glycosyltransferase 87 family protein [Amycolatopsis cihanbeyliensis]|uniref:glycosyltransferase 87 family protein n=1 Tax=Amycolatopsis cihanbeyliensis TaxID=1128664 RepID=UPI001FE5BDFC|nr:glycosyltransferase 87 family protein [Amycolatopsis cihanbeyliensis]